MIRQLSLTALCALPFAASPLAERGIEPTDFAARGRVPAGIVVEREIAASPTEVFDAWSTAQGIRAFLGVESSVELVVGGPYELYFGPTLPEGQRGGEGCRVLSYLPDRMLSFTWNAPPRYPTERQLRSWVVLLFEPSGPADDPRTLVRLEHVGFGSDGNWPDVRRYFEHAWPNVMDALVAHFAADDPAVGQSD